MQYAWTIQDDAIDKNILLWVFVFIIQKKYFISSQ